MYACLCSGFVLRFVNLFLIRILFVFQALVRFGEGNAQSVREKALEAGEGKIVIKEAELETRILEGGYFFKFFSRC